MVVTVDSKKSRSDDKGCQRNADPSLLLDCLDKVHTTEGGVIRIRRNLNLSVPDVVAWCTSRIASGEGEITRKGKNWYFSDSFCVITINAHSYTIITAHPLG